jgi:hypothetical protein
MAKAKQSGLTAVEDITRSVLVLRGHRVLLDAPVSITRMDSSPATEAILQSTKSVKNVEFTFLFP